MLYTTYYYIKLEFRKGDKPTHYEIRESKRRHCVVLQTKGWERGMVVAARCKVRGGRKRREASVVTLQTEGQESEHHRVTS
jgi:hypothetical protein